MDKPPVINEGAWAFPTIDLNDTADCTVESEPELNEESDMEVTSSAMDEVPVPPPADVKTVPYDELVSLKEGYENQIMELKSDFRNKVESVNHLLDELESPLSVFDNEIISLMQLMIKKITKKIIYKEIETDPSTITHMVEELKKLLNESNAAIATVYLSDSDFKILNHKNKNAKLVIASDENLDTGDIIIKSNLSEVQAILTERIDQILGTRHG